MKSVLVFVILAFTAYLGRGQSVVNGEMCNNATEYYSEDTNQCCKKCLPGTRKANDCTTNTDTDCEPCKEGTYSNTLNYYPKCFRCSTCASEKNMQYVKKCSSDSNAVCACKPDTFCYLTEGSKCSECKRYKKCDVGKGVEKPGTPDRDIVCATCPNGTFSDTSDRQPCKPHTRCKDLGRVELQAGTTTTDTVCGSILIEPVTTKRPHIMAQTTTYTSITTEPTKHHSTFSTGDIKSTVHKTLLTRAPKENPIPYWIGLAAAGAVLVLVLLMVATFVIRHRKDTVKPMVCEVSETQDSSEPAHIYSPPECHSLLMDSKIDQSSSSSSDCYSQSTANSQDYIHSEPSTISSPCLNVSFTATFNYKVNPATGTCSIPISPSVQQQQQEPEFPLSQEEELCMSSQQEDGKAALQSVQESMSVY